MSWSSKAPPVNFYLYQGWIRANIDSRVGIEGDHGAVEISDMLFTVKGATAGAILLEWNVHESVQGSGA